MLAVKLKAQNQATPLEQLIQGFNPISLKALKNKAELMARRDNKYVLDSEQILTFLSHAQTEFDILEIDGLNQFHYLSHYYDSAQLRTHLDHNQGRRRRIKIRHRNYMDSGLHYFEIKLKGRRNLTQKFRVSFNPAELDEQGLTPELTHFYLNILTEHYGADFAQSWLNQLIPSISVGYYRITLVAKTGDMRITIDNRIYFHQAARQSSSQANSKLALNNDKWIIEVKSSTGRTELDRWMFQNLSRAVSLCSKYGMGISLLKLPHRNTRFTPTLRRHFQSNHLQSTSLP